jgi:hypothetical protein
MKQKLREIRSANLPTTLDRAKVRAAVKEVRREREAREAEEARKRAGKSGNAEARD